MTPTAGPSRFGSAAAASGTHTLVVGATGSGKTVTQTWIAAHAIERGMARRSWSTPRAIAPCARRCAAPRSAAAGASSNGLPRGPSVYNPYARGSETEIADKALAGERFTEPHYLRQAQRYLGHAVRALRGGGRAR